MTVHFIHVGKTGGTAIKRTLRRHGFAYRARETPHGPETPYGRIEVHPHSFHMRDVREGDFAFFFLRDPVERFRSGFLSRRNKGRPGHFYEWTAAERRAFEAFSTANELVAALASPDIDQRLLAESAMRHIRHLGFMDRVVGTPEQLHARLGQVVFIGMQETLAGDWELLKAILELPPDIALPTEPRSAHRQDPAQKDVLDDELLGVLRDWYGRDYRLLAYCHRVRARRGWGPRS